MVFTELKSGKKRFLALNGAGFRSFSTLLVLEGLMNIVSFRAHKVLSPNDVFDLIGGSSGGGLAAILVGRLGLDCASAIKIYKDLAVALYGSDEGLSLQSVLNSFESEPSSEAFESLLEEIINRHSAQTGAGFIASAASTENRAKTFVPVACVAPFNNSTYCVRTYPTPLRAPPLRHDWTTQEVARSSIAARINLPPLVLDKKFSFRDPAYAGFSSPISFLHKESSTLWSNDDIGVVVNIGVDLQAFIPSEVCAHWTINESQLKPFVDKLLTKIPERDRGNPEIRSGASFIIKQYMGMAVETELAFNDVASKGVFPSDALVRLDPHTGLTETDLVDCFNLDTIERNVKSWLVGDGKAILEQISAKLVDVGSEPLTAEIVKHIPPPAPPKNTNAGYNKKLDQPRPETMMDYLQNYHVIFIIDDSGSMEGERWAEARDALLDIADFAKNYDCNEVDIQFLNNQAVYRGVQGRSMIQNIFQTARPRGLTPTGSCLDTVINSHIDKLDAMVNMSAYGLVKPLDIIVLTDGVPTDDPNEVLARAVARRKAAKHHPNAIGVQVVQIGDDEDAGPALQALMYGDVESMVDTVPYNGQLTPRELERILLGGLHPNVRALIPVQKRV